MNHFISPSNGIKIAGLPSVSAPMKLGRDVLSFILFILLILIGMILFLIMLDNFRFVQTMEGFLLGIGYLICFIIVLYCNIEKQYTHFYRRSKMDSPNVFYIDFMNKRGVEIDNEFLPFAYDCITSCKIDGDFLILKYEGENSRWKHSLRILKFKIEPEYLSYKRELLDFLNSWNKL
jgi:uncharacterized membrane protein